MVSVAAEVLSGAATSYMLRYDLDQQLEPVHHQIIMPLDDRCV